MSSKKKYPPFVVHECTECGQTKDYAMGLDHGTALIVIAVANAARRLKRPRVHLLKEVVSGKSSDDYGAMVRAGYMTVRMMGNATRARYHGLIALASNEKWGAGYYAVTRKGYDFLANNPVPHTVIVDKARGINAGYYGPAGMVTLQQLLKGKKHFWEGEALVLGEFDNTLFSEGDNDEENVE